MSAQSGETESVARGMKSELFTAIVNATTDDWTGHLPNCGYTDEEQVCGCSEWGARLARAIEPFVPANCPQAGSEALTDAERSALRRVDDRLRATFRTPDMHAATIRVEAGDWTTVEEYVVRIIRRIAPPVVERACQGCLADAFAIAGTLASHTCDLSSSPGLDGGR